MPGYFDRYINLADNVSIVSALESSLEEVRKLNLELLHKIGNKVYAPGKWTVKDILQHVVDTEMVFCYRTLRFARKDSAAAGSFDENAFASNAAADRRPLEEIINELMVTRQGTIILFKSFTDQMLLNKGICWKYEMSSLAMGFTLAGHQKHHFNFMELNYYPLAR